MGPRVTTAGKTVVVSNARGIDAPYPGDSKIFAPDQVPGAYIPSSESDG